MKAITAGPARKFYVRASGVQRKIKTIGFGRWMYEAWRRHVVLRAIALRFVPLPQSKQLLPHFNGRSGIEIGGPSRFFSDGGHLPLYPIIKGLDNCNFADETIWEGRLREGEFRLGERVVGHQYICEASNIASHVTRRDYDFLISSNCLEHVANPLAAVRSWISVLRPGGTLTIVVPNQRHNFDHKRPVTAFAHILDDYRDGTGENDTTHFAEVLELTDLRLMSRHHVPDAAAFRQQVLNNISTRCVHHHVFDGELLRQIAAHFKLDVIDIIDAATEFILVARKAA